MQLQEVVLKLQKVFCCTLWSKALQNNTELININNKMGHGISYTSLMETQTENAYYILEQQSQDNVILPINCKKEAFHHLRCW